MYDSQLHLEWDSYQSNICKGLSLLQQRGEFVDMTIAADGHHVKVHQMVLSLISPFIKDLLASAQCPHPVIFLNKVSYQTLELVLEYAYTGQVLVTKEKLNEFLDACKSLHIKGLEADLRETQYCFNENIDTTATIEFHEQNEEDALDTNCMQPVPIKMQECEESDVRTGVKRKRVDLPVVDNNDIKPVLDNEWQTDIDNELIIETPVQVKSKPKTNTTSTMIHYSVSCQGSIQMVLNRFLYYLRHTKKNDDRLWRCKDYFKKACPAFTRTKGEIVVERGCSHNHAFHDKQILKRMRDGNMFTGFSTAETLAAIKKQKGSADTTISINNDVGDDDEEEYN